MKTNSVQTILDQNFMKKCFQLARKYEGFTSPNPLVGSVIVKNSKIIATGSHKKAGLAHAERDAIDNAIKLGFSEDLAGSTLYCNLEPCCHLDKKTPPCAQYIIEKQIKRVVISNLDPNPKVAGKGVALLRNAGIEVETGILEQAGHELNRIFFYHIQSDLPYIHLKWAQTLDGQIATRTGASKWITSSLSRKHVHKERKRYDAIFVGAQTARLDNPKLTVRAKDKVIKAPYRIVLSNKGLFDKNLFLLNDEYSDRSILICPSNLAEKRNPFKNCLKFRPGQFKLREILKELKRREVSSIYVEGGSSVHGLFLKERLFNELSVYIAPKVFGSSRPAVPDIGISTVNEGSFLQLKQQKKFRDDLFLNYLKT